jgi:hypothetical protein
MPASSPFEQRRVKIETQQSMQIQLNNVSGFIQVNGAGEALQDVNFPVWFVEKPTFTFGGELMDGHSPIKTKFPTISVMVARWNKEKRGYANYYVGASLAIVTTGDVTQQIIVHWSTVGKAIRNPIGPPLSDDI